jgi:starch synthase
LLFSFLRAKLTFDLALFVVALPEKALVLDWVFADGPPGNARNYDNNARQDFHAVVPNNISEDLWVEEEHRIFRRLQQERRERKDAERKKVG